jgi:hypothetical protein
MMGTQNTYEAAAHAAESAARTLNKSRSRLTGNRVDEDRITQR